MAVSNLISSAQTYADNIVTQARSAMDDATRAVGMIGYAVPYFQPVSLPDAPDKTIPLVPPELPPVDLTLPTDPVDAPLFQDIPPIVPRTAPVLTATAPTITMPTTPSQLGAFHNTAPSINTSITFPDPPDSLLHPLFEAPVLLDRAEPNKPQVMLSRFDALAPVDTTVAPSDLTGSFENAYRGAAPSTITMLDGYVDAMLTKHNPRYHEQMTRIETQLTTYMAGGTGLKAEVEDAIYARGQAKNDAEAKRMQDAALTDAAARGFTLPSGALMSAMARARQDAANLNAAKVNEIIILQAEMEQKNLQFAVMTSIGLRQSLLSAALGYHQNLIGINGQALDYAKTVLSSIIEVYNTAVKAYSIKLDAYRAEAAVFETRLKSDMASIELYRMEIAALEAVTNVDKAKVDVYRARIDSLTALSNVYRAQIEAVQGRVSLEKTKIDVFQAQVQAFSAQVQAKNSEWQGYIAAIGGEQAKAQLFNTRVGAYEAELQGYRADIDAKVEVVRAAAMTNDARARQYTATVQSYQTVVQARGLKASTELENQRHEIVAFQARVQAAVGQSQVTNEYYKSVSMVSIANAELKMKSMLSEVSSRKDYGETIARLGSSNAKVYADMAGAAMAGMNTLVAETTST